MRSRSFLARVKRRWRVTSDAPPFVSSGAYWELRYASGDSSGAGSYGRLAKYKAQFLESFLSANDVRSVVDLGCGDGHQVSLVQFNDYLGLDVSPTAVQLCRQKFQDDPGMSFALMKDYDGGPREVSLSLDVIYHLVEDDIFELYMASLFDWASRFVVIYSSNHEQTGHEHVRHRRFVDWVARERPRWALQEIEVNPLHSGFVSSSRERSPSDFYVFAWNG